MPPQASRLFSATARHRLPRHDVHASHYEVLGVSRGATPAEVKKCAPPPPPSPLIPLTTTSRRAFYALSKKSHPDHNRDDPTAAKRFARISEAYSILGTPAKRAKYDMTLAPDETAHHHHPSPHGSYHSSTGPAGGRPASGLSRRRTRFYGPPPSYKHSPHMHHAGHSTGHSHGPETHGGVGYGPHPYTRPLRPDETPYFDRESHHRTHVKQDERRTWRNEERAAYNRSVAKGQPSMGVNFVIFSSVLAFALTVPTVVDMIFNSDPVRTTPQRRRQRAPDA
jgi:curved DNA-binding protein CbpA